MSYPCPVVLCLHADATKYSCFFRGNSFLLMNEDYHDPLLSIDSDLVMLPAAFQILASNDTAARCHLAVASL
jgi:hypothetical protein